MKSPSNQFQGAGHYVPMDRPGPALQMVSNFLRNVDYSKPVPYSLDRKPLLPQYTVGSEILFFKYNFIIVFMAISTVVRYNFYSDAITYISSAKVCPLITPLPRLGRLPFQLQL